MASKPEVEIIEIDDEEDNVGNDANVAKVANVVDVENGKSVVNPEPVENVESIENVASVELSPEEAMCGIILQCIVNLIPYNDGSDAVKIQALQVISETCQFGFEAWIYPNLEAVGAVFLATFFDTSNPVLMQYAINAVLLLGEAINTNYNLENCKKHGSSIWQDFLDAPLAYLATSTVSGERSGAAYFMATIGDRVFQVLPEELQKKCYRIILSLALDPDSTVRRAVMHGIGRLLLYNPGKSYRFLGDAAEVISHTLLHDPCLHVRAHASLALANCSNALQLGTSKPFDANLLDAALLGSHDLEPISCNAVRALGDLLKLLDTQSNFTMDEKLIFLDNGVKVLLECVLGDCIISARLDACDALGSILQTQYAYFPDRPDGVRTSVMIFETLERILITSKNVRLRIKAAIALLSCTTRVNYSSKYISLWNSIVEGLVNAVEIVDSEEREHVNKLIIQSCMSLSHLTSVVEAVDMESLASLFTIQVDRLLFNYFGFTYGCLPSLHHLPMLNAAKRLNELIPSELTERGQQVLGLLKAIFANLPKKSE